MEIKLFNKLPKKAFSVTISLAKFKIVMTSKWLIKHLIPLNNICTIT